MNACIKVHAEDEEHETVKETHDVLIQEAGSLMKSSNDHPHSKEAEKPKKSVDSRLFDFLSILHLVHYNVICPESSQCVQMVGWGTKIEATLVPHNVLTQPEWPAILV